MSEEKDYCYSVSGEQFGDDWNEILDELDINDDLLVGATYYRGVKKQHKPSYFFNIDAIIEGANERAYEEGGDFADDGVNCTPELQEELERIIHEWADKNLSVNFWNVVDIEKLTITAEDIAAFNGADT